MKEGDTLEGGENRIAIVTQGETCVRTGDSLPITVPVLGLWTPISRATFPPFPLAISRLSRSIAGHNKIRHA